MPTVIEINSSYFKYCKTYDVHCSCMTCVSFNEQDEEACPSCAGCTKHHAELDEKTEFELGKPHCGSYLKNEYS